MIADPLVAVGKNCDCGHPLVWVRGQQRCAVYGSHPAHGDTAAFHRPPGRPIGFRNHNAPGAPLIDLSLALSYPRKRSAA
jgi:hypothetical protein